MNRNRNRNKSSHVMSCLVIVMTSNLKVKGKMASLTENRRLSWEMIVWPLIVELDRPFFTVREYQAKRDYVSGRYGIQISRIRFWFCLFDPQGICYQRSSRILSQWGTSEIYT